MWKYKLKELFNRPAFTAIFTFVVTASVVLAFTLPFMNSGSSIGDIVAYTRDSHSGAREVFLKTIGMDLGKQKFSSNVIETGKAESMAKDVLRNNKAIGYASASQFIDYAKFDPANPDKRTDMLKDDRAYVLDLNGVNPFNKDDLNNTDNYDAKRPFNAFWRVNEDVASQWKFDDKTGIFTVPSSANDDQKMSWAFYNYLTTSEEVVETIPLTRSSKTISFESKVKWGTLNIEVTTKEKELKVETVGSTSVIPALGNAFIGTKAKGYKDGFATIAENKVISNIKVIHDASHTGSGDAFNKEPKGYIGFQSRALKLGEGINWGYDTSKSTDPLITSGYYTDYETDALVFFVNKTNALYLKTGVKQNITAGILNLIYTSGKLNWEELYRLF